MLIKKSNQTAKIRITPSFGDLSLFVQLMQSNIWRQLYMGDRKALWNIALWVISSKIDMFAQPLRAILRYDFGRHTTGVLMSVWALVLIIAFNVTHIVGWFFVFLPFGGPATVFLVPLETLISLVFIDIHSKPLMVLAIAFSIFQGTHLVRIYLERGNTTDHKKRGQSWIVMLLKSKLKINEVMFQCYLEPIIGLAIGYVVMMIFGDQVFFIYMFASSICLFIQEFSDVAYRYYLSRY